jgi:hypothetical protein
LSGNEDESLTLPWKMWPPSSPDLSLFLIITFFFNGCLLWASRGRLLSIAGYFAYVNVSTREYLTESRQNQAAAGTATNELTYLNVGVSVHR